MVDWGRSFLAATVIAAVLFIVSFVIYGSQPKVGAAADKLVSRSTTATARGFSLPRSSSASRPCA